jgi:hypothetical protein
MKLRLLALAVLAGPVALLAQPTSAVFRSVLLESVAPTYSYSSPEAIAGAGYSGEVGVQRLDFSFSGRRALSESWQLAYGFAFADNHLDRAGSVALSDHLTELSLNLGATRKISPQWSASVFLRPGFYSDDLSIEGDAFNVPLLGLAQYAARKELVWLFGVSVNPFGDNPVLPVAGVRWQFAPAWTFNLGFPQAGLLWRPNPAVTWRAGASFQGGSFRVTEDPANTAPGPRLAGALLDYREVRVGLGADLKLGGRWELAFDTGAVIDRNFDYFRLGYELDGDAGFYGTLSLRAGF